MTEIWKSGSVLVSHLYFFTINYTNSVSHYPIRVLVKAALSAWTNKQRKLLNKETQQLKSIFTFNSEIKTINLSPTVKRTPSAMGMMCQQHHLSGRCPGLPTVLCKHYPRTFHTVAKNEMYLSWHAVIIIQIKYSYFPVDEDF